MTQQWHGELGRADLLEVRSRLAERGEDATAIANVSRMLGFESRPSAPRPAPARKVDRLEAKTPEPSGSPSEALEDVPFWQPRTLERHEQSSPRTPTPDELRRAETTDAQERAEMATHAPPTPSPLSSRRRLVPRLEHAVVAKSSGDELDVDALVDAMGRGDPIHEFPRLPRREWPAVVLLVDRSWPLVPFWEDQRLVFEWLQRIVGPSSLVVRVVDDRGPDIRVFDLHGRATSPFEGALAGLPVLALTDLGWYRGPAVQRAWLRLGRRLRRAGERVVALVPVPRARWTSSLRSAWAPIPWERPCGGDAAAADAEASTAGVDRLLAMAACAHRLEPGLLRELRRTLPRATADVGTEADVWMHEDLGGGFPDAAVMKGDRAAIRREQLSRDDAVRVAAALRRWHWHRERQPELWHCEALGLDRIEPGVLDPAWIDAAEGFTERLGERVRRAEQAERRGSPEGLGPWLEYVERHAPRDLWRPDTRAGRGLQIAWWATRPGGRPPPDPDPALEQWATGRPPGDARAYTLWQVGRGLSMAPDPTQGGSRLAAFEAAGPVAYLDDRLRSREFVLKSDAPIDVGRPIRLELRTDRATLVLEPLTQPAWATAMGRDRFGLWAELWAELGVGGVGHRMRWIAPGRFTMGSPKDEPGRYPSEGPCHTVTISRGFWIGETTVTQALWEAVTSKNPSRFKTPDRPVEYVNWDDCQTEFIDRLNRFIDTDHGEMFRFPTEAEWEYACRAGTDMVTYVGPMEILGDNNAPVLDAIAWYGGNSGVDFDLENGSDSSGLKEKHHEHQQAGTRRVKQKQPNQWGLYDMLGNVWEWCMDERHEYSSEPQLDPLGPTRTGGYRVCRGGSWSSPARRVRAAYRGAHPPGPHFDDRGLRLVRGQEVRTEPGPEGQA